MRTAAATAGPATTSRSPELDWNRFRIRLAGDPGDRRAAWELARAVNKTGDTPCPDLDHLVIEERDGDETVAVLPLANSLRTGRFASAGLFRLGELPVREGVKVEIGRPWLKHGWRNTQSLNALAHGVAWYSHLARVRWLFGCVQVRPDHRLDRVAFARWLVGQGMQLPEIGVRPHTARSVPGMHGWILRDALEPGESARVQRQLPPGLRLVLHLGARVHPFPAVHDDDGTLSYFMLIDRRETHPDGSHASSAMPATRRR